MPRRKRGDGPRDLQSPAPGSQFDPNETTAERRARLRAEYGDLYDAALALLFRVDPDGINFSPNTDEYEPEVTTILPRLRSATSLDDVRNIVYEELARWFDDRTAGRERQADRIAPELWTLWQEHLRSVRRRTL